MICHPFWDSYSWTSVPHNSLAKPGIFWWHLCCCICQMLHLHSDLDWTPKIGHQWRQDRSDEALPLHRESFPTSTTRKVVVHGIRVQNCTCLCIFYIYIYNYIYIMYIHVCVCTSYIFYIFRSHPNPNGLYVDHQQDKMTMAIAKFCANWRSMSCTPSSDMTDLGLDLLRAMVLNYRTYRTWNLGLDGWGLNSC